MDFLDRVGKTREAMEGINRDALHRQREAGQIYRRSSDSQIDLYSARSASQTAAVSMRGQPPSLEAFSFMEEQVRAVEDPRGARYTASHGNVSLLNGSSAAVSRAKNTRLTDAKSLHSSGDVDNGSYNHADMETAINNSIRSERLRVEQPLVREPRGITPTSGTAVKSPLDGKTMNAPAAATAITVSSKTKTPVEIEEVRDAAMLEICLESSSDRADILHDVLDDLSCPYDKKTMKEHSLLVKKGKSVNERVDGLANWVGAQKKRWN